MQQQQQQQWVMNANGIIVPYKNGNGNMNDNVIGMGGNNAGPFFRQSGAETRTFSNFNNCVTQNLQHPNPNPLTLPTVPPGVIPLHRTYLS